MSANGLIYAAIFVLIVAASGCAGTANTSNPSTYDLLFRQDQLQANLAAKRAELGDLNRTLEVLDSDLANEIDSLSKAQFDLISSNLELKSKQEEAVRIANEMAAQIESSRDARSKLKQLRRQQNELEAMIASAAVEQAETEIRLAELQNEINSLQTQVTAIQVANRRLQDLHMSILSDDLEVS